MFLSKCIRFVLIVGLFLSTQNALAIDDSCHWLAENYFAEEFLAKLDPAHELAIRDILRKYYFNPKRSISADDKDWINKFEHINLGDAVEQIRKLGVKELKKETNAERMTRLMRFGGTAIPLGIMGYFVGAQLLETADLEYVLHKKMGMKVYHRWDKDKSSINFENTSPSQSELRFLQAILECNPNYNHGSLVKYIDDKIFEKKRDEIIDEKKLRDLGLTTFDDITKKARAIYDLTSVKKYGMEFDKLVNMLLIGSEKSADVSFKYYPEGTKKAKNMSAPIGTLAYELWKTHQVAFCTMWGHPSEKFFNSPDIENFAKFFGSLKPKYYPAMRKANNIIRVHKDFRPRGLDSHVIGVYFPNINSIQFYHADQYDAIHHELAHMLSDLSDIGRGDSNWKKINWDLTLKEGRTPKDGSWWPNPSATYIKGVTYKKGFTSKNEVYSMKNPEENWAEAVACFLNKECAEQMKKRSPEMYKYVSQAFYSPLDRHTLTFLTSLLAVGEGEMMNKQLARLKSDLKFSKTVLEFTNEDIKKVKSGNLAELTYKYVSDHAIARIKNRNSRPERDVVQKEMLILLEEKKKKTLSEISKVEDKIKELEEQLNSK